MTDWVVPIFGPLAWIDVILLVWFTLTAFSVIYVAYDAITNNPEMKVMKWGWVLVTLYLGPLALFLYIMSCKEPAPGTHEEFVNPLWKQSLGSTIHCVAGDATGIIVAAAITALVLRSPPLGGRLEDRMSLPLKRRLALDAVARVTRMDRAEPQTRRASRGQS